MATLVLQVAGQAIGSALGGPAGGLIGRAVGAVAGSLIDQSLLSAGARAERRQGPRLKELDGITSSEGAPIPRVYGRARLGGQVIWATRFEEFISVRREGGSRGGKSRSTAPSQPAAQVTTYSYFANVAIALCEGEIAFVRSIWADGKLIDPASLTMRVHRGTETQPADPLIAAKQGATSTPAYRGTAYVVFERLPLEPYGNRLPQFSFEVVRPVQGLGASIRSVALIPGSGEFVYSPAPVSRNFGFGAAQSENRHVLTHASDWAASIDALQALCPNLQSVALVVAWFGDDLRAGQCTIAPRVDLAGKVTYGAAWSVAGLERSAAVLSSQIGGRAAFGGTPSDASVIAAIRDLKLRGLKVVFYPFVMMDIPAANTKTDPWTGAASQPASLSLARPHHLRPGPWSAGHRRRDSRSGGSSQRAVWTGVAFALFRQR